MAIGKGVVDVIIATAGAAEMAEWKDQHFKEYLEKKKEDIMNNPYTGHCLSDIYLIDDIIAELFPNDKEQN